MISLLQSYTCWNFGDEIVDSFVYVFAYLLQYRSRPIHYASGNGQVQVVEKLISLGADVNVADEVRKLLL